MYKKILPCIFTAILIIFTNTKICFAETQEAAQSAMPKFRQIDEIKFDYRVHVLRKFLSKFNSPLTPYSLEFIKQADYYNIDYRLVPAITGVESTFGKNIPSKSFNAYGWGGGNYGFESWPNSIEIVSKALKNNYINRGATSITKIAKIYAPPSTTWGWKVEYFINKINVLPLSFDI
jgi:hypothetical protein